jgi:hypothetical protein
MKNELSFGSEGEGGGEAWNAKQKEIFIQALARPGDAFAAQRHK